MSIKRYYASKDNTISNAYQEDLKTRATGSNMGSSDILEVFSIYGQISSSVSGYSSEKSRILIQFPISDISTDRSSNLIPKSGNVNFYLKLSNARHGDSVPTGAKLVVSAISKDWDEGIGMDMEQYKDIGVSNWISASEGVAWTTQGGDYHTTPFFEQTFDTGVEDLEIDVTTLVEQWLAGTKTNYGFGVYLTSSQENSTDRSYYTKKFFGRGTEFFFKKPIIEARFNDAKKDGRGDFYYSSSLATATDNLNTIYLYNKVRGVLRDIPSVGTGNIYVSIFSGSADNNSPSGSAITLVADGTRVNLPNTTVVTGGWVETGIYSASFAATSATTPVQTLYDVWHNGNLNTQYHTGSIVPNILRADYYPGADKYLIKLTNLKPQYLTDETALIRMYARPRNWYPNIYTIASATPENTIINSSSYSVYRIKDDLKVIPHGTGSTLHTLMSHDVSGNYFKFDMGILEPDYAYAFEIAIYNDATTRWEVQPETFKFRVEKRQTE